MDVVLRRLSPDAASPEVEIVERKGLGHPDQLCDAMADAVERALARLYLERFGRVLHHNVDKALLRAGAARAVFGGGEVLAPLQLTFAGRALSKVGEARVPVRELAVETARRYLANHLRHLDVERHVEVIAALREGSHELVALFEREGPARANDTSVGVGFWPLTATERLVLDLELELNAAAHRSARPWAGEDVKVMGVRHGDRLQLTVARAFVSRFVPDLDAYLAYKDELREHVRARAADLAPRIDVDVNAADDLARRDVYLTVTGTSAESADDGQVGRGGRLNGLITPLRPMSLEAVAGKNPRTHVGKLYNVLAQRIAQRAVDEVPGVERCVCALVSEIGRPVREPRLVDLQLLGDEARFGAVEPLARDELDRAEELWRPLVLGELAAVR